MTEAVSGSHVTRLTPESNKLGECLRVSFSCFPAALPWAGYAKIIDGGTEVE
jgi:hypothetical protein